MQEWLECFKFLVPIVTFWLGVWATPLIEARKEQAKAKSVYKNLILEIEDELDELPNKLIKMAKVLKNLTKFKKGEVASGLCHYSPRSINCYFLKLATETSFSLFNKDQRFAIKSLFVLIGVLESRLSAIVNTKLSNENIDECIDNCKRYLSVGGGMLNTMRIIVNRAHADPAEGDKEIIEAIFLELDIELSFDDLGIKSKICLNQID